MFCPLKASLFGFIKRFSSRFEICSYKFHNKYISQLPKKRTCFSFPYFSKIWTNAARFKTLQSNTFTSFHLVHLSKKGGNTTKKFFSAMYVAASGVFTRRSKRRLRSPNRLMMMSWWAQICLSFTCWSESHRFFHLSIFFELLAPP